VKHEDLPGGRPS